MFRLLLISIVLAPVLLGMHAAGRRSRRRGLMVLVMLVFAYLSMYLLMLYYLRVRWVGWASG